MKKQSVHQQTQGRETTDTQRQGLLVCRYHRSLKTGPGRLRVPNSGFAPLSLLMCLILLASAVPARNSKQTTEARRTAELRKGHFR
jgi:hypothetical protein